MQENVICAILQVSQEVSSTSAINPTTTTTLCWPALICHICQGPGIWGLRNVGKKDLPLSTICKLARETVLRWLFRKLTLFKNGRSENVPAVIFDILLPSRLISCNDS